ncbi:MAG TPA: thioredoxin family protein [Planctomycetota bacterium]|nr:thioredoxin family protein [Planctomycetota bacterium]HRR81184.1 thioredoxin family protein [Planctomycetota bacterium]HRT95655.1 thioredoxin family protein [Planctomycetota bacterium]
MTRIQVLGPGCPSCAKLAQNAEAAAKALGLDYQLEKVTDIMKILEFGVMITPALVVDGKIKVAGKVPSVEDVQKLLA